MSFLRVGAKLYNKKHFSSNQLQLNMIFPQSLQLNSFYALCDAIGVSGKLLVIVTIGLETRFHLIR